MRSFDKMKIFRFFLPSFFWLSLLIVPLGMSYFFPVASPFVLVKSVWLEILAAATMLALLPFIFGHNQKSSLFLTSSLWRRSVLPVWIFWLAWSLLSIFSVYPLQSWLGSYLRQTGLLFYFWLAFWYSFVVYYFGGFYRTDNSFSFWKKGAGLSAFLMGAAGTVAGVYAFLQFCGYDFAVWQESQLYGRAIGTLGQPNFLGSFLLATLAMTAYTFFSASNIRWKIFSVFMFVCQLAGLVLSGSRSAWLAFIVVLVFLFVLLFLVLGRWT
jgi:putative inorganic carbon (HCO3(-)) transporter